MVRKKILVFDDDIPTLEVVSLICEDLGYEVITAESADDIIAKVSYFLPDLILMDINIPTIGGINATKLIKSHETYNTIPIMFITATNDVAHLSSEAHVDGYLSKPFDIDELGEIIKKLI